MTPSAAAIFLLLTTSANAPAAGGVYHHKIDVAIGLATLSQRLGRSIRFDPMARRIVGDEEAARLARPEYRHPWKFPEEYL